jgi:hypothetical protein
MELDAATRGLLEKIIDSVLSNAHELVKPLFNPESEERKQLYIENESDFALGFASGLIHGWCISSFGTMHMRLPNAYEKSEIAAMINRRLREVRESIFKPG